MLANTAHGCDRQFVIRDYNPLPTIQRKAPLIPKTVNEFSARLRKATKTRNKLEIMNIITAHSNRQRQQIVVQYQKDYGVELGADLKKALRGNFQELILSLIALPTELICRHLNKAMSGFSTNEKTLVELLVPRTNEEMKEIADLYERLYDRPLIEHICSSTSKHFRRLLSLIISGKRDESTTADPMKARDLAGQLYIATEVKTNERQTFNRILSRENFAQLRLVFDHFEEISGGSTIEEAVEKEMSGDVYDGIIAIVECSRYVPGFFAGCLFRALKGWTTDDTALIRILVTRSEIDLGNIKQSYQQIYNKDLQTEIESTTSGEYKCAMLSLLHD